jgi:hypothetical protein
MVPGCCPSGVLHADNTEKYDAIVMRREAVFDASGHVGQSANHSLGSTGSLSIASTPKTHSCTRRNDGAFYILVRTAGPRIQLPMRP